jgi:hypothetical protein
MDISSNSKPYWEEPIQKNQWQKSLLYCPFKLLYEPGAQPLQRKVLILLSSTDLFCFIYFVSLFSFYIHFVSHAKISVSLRSKTSETNPLFRLEAKFFSLPFSHRFASMRNERRTLRGLLSLIPILWPKAWKSSHLFTVRIHFAQ